MGCSSCSTGSNGLPGGCKNNGACGTYGCNKLEVFDWLSGMALPDGQKPFDIVEVRFKNSRKAFFRNVSNLELYPGDVVAVEASPGHDVGVVSITGELVRIQMKRKDVKDNYEIKKLFRKAKEEDIVKWQEGRKLEQETMMRARTLARELQLEMKLSDVEYQGDKTKATFFYTADGRVDFRELIRKYAEEFKVRVEMRQIGYRYEAGRLGGIGSCGRELCCSSWLTDYRAVSTSAARYQQLSLNPQKLAGQCGKLKCCLNYELDQYVEALKEFPSTQVRLQLPKGTASHFKTDLFGRLIYYIYEGQPGEPPFALTVDAAKEIIDRNKRGVAVKDVEEYMVEEVVVEETDFAQVVGQDSLTRFDRKKTRGGKSRNKGRDTRKPEGNRPEGGAPRPQQPQQRRPEGGGGNPNQQRRPEGGAKPNTGNPNQQRGKEGNRGNQPNERNSGKPPQDQRPPRNENRGDKPRGPRPPRPNKPNGNTDQPAKES
ncbi:MAG: regulatory iron-sulfur-containing complex subunit RicT [Flavobacteriales bacterium]